MYVMKKDGVFHYLPQGHKLEQLSDGDHRADLAQAAMGQNSVQSAPVSFVFAAVYQRTRARYGDRAERYVHMEAGHAAENIHLEAVALGLASVPVGAFDDGEVAKALSLPADQAPIYIIPVGYPAG
jgi:SagB-type dehydrogenase family enzyme